MLIRYAYEMGGDGNAAEIGDDLLLDYFDSAGNWINLKRHLGGGVRMASYIVEQFILPAGAYHRDFAIRFRITGDANDDDWFVDDLSIVLPPVISIMPNRFEVTLSSGDSTTQTLMIENRGASDFQYSISIQPRSAAPQMEMFGAGIAEPVVQTLLSDEAYARQAGNIGPLSQSQRGDNSAALASAPTPAAPAHTSAALRVLSWTGYVDFSREYPNTLAALRQFFIDFTLTETSTQTPSDLQALLNTADVFLIPGQETSINLTSLGASWIFLIIMPKTHACWRTRCNGEAPG